MDFSFFKNPRFILLIIALVTIYAAVIDLPQTSINFSYDYKHLQNIPVVKNWVKDKKLEVNTEIGGYTLDLFNGRIRRDLEIKQGLDIAGGVSVVLDADVSQIAEAERKDAIESLINVIERRVNLLGISEATVQSARQGDSYRVIVELAGLQDTSEAIKAIGQTAQLDFRELQDLPEEIAKDLPEDQPRQFYASTGLTGADLRRANVSFSQSGGVATNAPEIELLFSTEGAKKFKEITERNLQKPVAIYLDETLLMDPVVQSVIPNGQAVITGQYTLDEVKTITAQLNSGALPVPVKVVEQKTVGPSLGQESVDRSVRAGLLGLSLVILFMIAYYRSLGFFASIALIIYGIVTLALYKLIPVTLTLPGLAGFILSIGMAVDANILIFERIKEELRAGKPLAIAFENGFGRSWDSIRDANTATLMTAFILFNPLNWSFLPTSGLVRGFALTLALGILISIFTGVFVTRNLVRVFYRRSKYD